MMFACKSYVLSTEQSCVYGTNAGAGITMVVVVVIIIFVVTVLLCFFFFFFSSIRRHTSFDCDWSSDVCSSDLIEHRQHDSAGPRTGPDVEPFRRPPHRAQPAAEPARLRDPAVQCRRHVGDAGSAVDGDQLEDRKSVV